MRATRRIMAGCSWRGPDELTRGERLNQLCLVGCNEEDKTILLDGLKPVHYPLVVSRVDLVEGRSGRIRGEMRSMRMHLLGRVMVVAGGLLMDVSEGRFDEAKHQRTGDENGAGPAH